MPQRPEATGNDPATWIVVPSRRTETVIMTGRVMPRSMSRPGSVAFAFLEPDPEIAWDDERVARIRQALGGSAPPAA
jgi:hypothetical protein